MKFGQSKCMLERLAHMQGTKMMLVDHSARQLVVTGVESDARYPCSRGDGGVIGRVAATGTPELLRNATSDRDFRRCVDGGGVAIDDMLALPVLKAAATGGGVAAGGVAGEGPEAATAHEAEASSAAGAARESSQDRTPHPNVIAVLQARFAIRCDNFAASCSDVASTRRCLASCANATGHNSEC
jgi:hypothetical protein